MPVKAGAGLGGAAASVAKAILSGEAEATGRANSSCVLASKKGFRDKGRGGGSKGDRWPLELAGDAARLRKGLLEERLRVSPREG